MSAGARHLAISAPYPLVDASEGYAVLRLRGPHMHAPDVVDDELVDDVEQHAHDWQRYAGQLRSLITSGWHIQEHGAVYATRALRADGLVELAAGDELQPGTLVEWCVADSNGGLCSIGGLVSGHPAPADTFPGAPLPALVENALTGAQRLVRDPGELAATVRAELHACAAWWREHPEQLSDYAVHGLPAELDELAESLEREPVPSTASEPASARRLFDSDGHHTRVSVYAASAIVFSGIAEAMRCYGGVSIPAPREGQADTLRQRGTQLAAVLGVASI